MDPLARELKLRLRAAGSCDAAWEVIARSPFFDEIETHPDVLSEASRVLLDCARAARDPLRGVYLATYVRLGIASGLFLFCPIDEATDRPREPEDWRLEADQIIPFMRGGEPEGRTVAALALNATKNVRRDHADEVAHVIAHDPDSTATAILRLFLSRHRSLGVHASDLLVLPATAAGNPEQRLAQLFNIGALTLSGQMLDPDTLDALLDFVERPDAFPEGWGLAYGKRRLSTRDVAYDLLEVARTVEPASFALRLLTSDQSARAQYSAFSLTFLVPAERFPCGPVLAELSDAEKKVLTKTQQIPGDVYLKLGIGRHELVGFLRGQGFRYRPVSIEVNGLRWEAHLGAVVRRMALGELPVTTVADAIAQEGSAKELVHCVLSDLHAIAHLFRTREEHANVHDLACRLAAAAIKKEQGACRLLVDGIVRCNERNSTSSHVAAAIQGVVAHCGVLPPEVEQKAVELLSAPLALQAGESLLRSLAPEVRERLILGSKEKQVHEEGKACDAGYLLRAAGGRTCSPGRGEGREGCALLGRRLER
ncbi:hypothetical protein [Sorangium sp. So ce117]|uniref:hypothetical protein n=1 Tax=Sorangium sp. So ce117 TaxID=3133277 RepID=UPI003F5EC6D8